MVDRGGHYASRDGRVDEQNHGDNVMKRTMASNRNVGPTIVILAILCGNGVSQALASDELRDAIAAAGGRVYQISMESEDLEVSFHLSDHEVGDDQLTRLHELGNVVWLNLKGTQITDEGLAAVGKLTALKKLHLELTKIGDDGLRHLAPLQELEYLNLYGTQVSDNGLALLLPLKNLKKVYVWQSQVTDQGMADFAAKRPDVQIIGAVKMPLIETADEKKETDKKEGDEKKKADEKKDDEKKKEEKKDGDS